MVIRIPQTLILWLPWLLFVGEVILVLTVGPMLIANARRRRNLPPLPLISRVARCFVGSVLAILVWTAAFFLLQALNFHRVSLAVQIIAICLLLAFISIIAFLIAARVCAGPMEEPKATPRRRKYFIAPGLLILVCIWAFWGTFIPWFGHTFRSMYRSMNVYQLKGIGTGLSQYMKNHQTYPERLGQLVDATYVHPFEFRLFCVNRSIDIEEQVKGQSFHVPKEFHYVRLPKSAPGNLVWVWFDPTLYDGRNVPVVYKDSRVDTIPPEILCSELYNTYRWLLAPDARKPAVENPPADAADRNFILFRIPEVFLNGLFPLYLFLGEVVVVLTIGPWLIGLACRDYHVPPPTVSQRVRICFRASLRGIGLWWLCYLACEIIAGLLGTFCHWAGVQFPTILGIILVVSLFTVAFVITLRYTAQQCMPQELLPWTNKKRLLGPALLIVISTVLWWIIFYTTFLASLQIPNASLDCARLFQIDTRLNEYAQKHGCYPETFSDLIQKEGENPYHIFDFRGLPMDREELKNHPDILAQKIRYSRLPADAPGELLWVWPEPALYDGTRSPVLWKSGHIQALFPEEIAERIGQTYEWLWEHRRTKMSRTPPNGKPARVSACR